MGLNPIRVLIIHPDRAHEYAKVDQDMATFTTLVGGFYEDIQTPKAALLFGENAKDRHAPINEMATYLWWKLVPSIEGKDVLAGTVVITGPVAGDQLTDLEPEIEAFWESMVRVTAAQAP